MNINLRRVVLDGQSGLVVGRRKDGTVIVLVDDGSLTEWVDESFLTFTNH